MPIQKTTKKEILLTCAKVFRQHGYSNTSMSDLAEACGLTKGLFYHHFASKEELMQAVLESVYQHFNATLFQPVYVDSSNLGPEEKLQTFVRRAERLFTTADGGCLMANIALETLGTDSAFSPCLRRFFAQWVAAMAHIYEANYQPAIAQTIAEQVVQDVEGGIMLMRIFGDKHYIEEALKRATARLSIP
jgi:TetR/AcrR family transcriptional regulator, transcriptional repressor for nem operon